MKSQYDPTNMDVFGVGHCKGREGCEVRGFVFNYASPCNHLTVPSTFST